MYPQQYSGQQITTYYRPAQQMTDILNAILPIMMLALVFGMITPMFKGMSREMA
jgi:hypothetical protein